MENKINIAELLKDCPKGMELYSPLCGDCKLYDVNEYNIRIETPNKDTLISLYHDGKYCSGGEIMLFPKGKTTWEGFYRPFKNGDIVYNRLQDTIGIVMYDKNDFLCKICDVSKNDVLWYNEGSLIAIVERDYRFATEKEKQKLFQAIKEQGYKWNEETKTLEKLKFKMGNRVKSKINQYEYTIKDITKDGYIMHSTTDKLGYYVPFCDEDYFNLALNKFDITTLKPFESKVLVRHNRDNKWCGSFFSHIDEDFHSHCYKFVTTAGKSYPMCIPYEGNQHLLGKTHDCDEYYKSWK